MQEYKLFEGNMDFAQMLWEGEFDGEKQKSTDTKPQLSWRWSSRPITKVEMPNFLLSIHTTTAAAAAGSNTATTTHALNFPPGCSADDSTCHVASYASGGASLEVSPVDVGSNLECRLPASQPSQEWMLRGRRRGMSSSTASSGGSSEREQPLGILCPFCMKNGETREFYTTHKVKDVRGRVICPVLRAYTCPICGDTGDRAHTASHCPYAAAHGGRRRSVPNSLRTARTSCGRARRVGYNTKNRH